MSRIRLSWLALPLLCMHACFVSPAPETRYWTCQEDSDCVAGYYCTKGYCLAPCSTEEDCQQARKEQCIDYICKPCEPGSTKACYTGAPATRGKGLCKDGQQTCTPSFTWTACEKQVLPVAEVCDDKDNNCDGKVDEGCDCQSGQTKPCYDGPKGTDGKGACKAGKQTCRQGRWSVCEEQFVPRAETCDGLDDDCDGSIDETTNDVGRACKAAGKKGGCAIGRTVCSNGKLTCLSLFLPKAEDCNGIDDDCDGTIDNLAGKPAYSLTRKCFSVTRGCTYSTQNNNYRCSGTCQAGTQSCLPIGSWASACEGEKLPVEESCDNKDNNCDGTIDNNATCPSGKSCRGGKCQ